MNKKNIMKWLGILMAASLVLTACGGGDAETPSANGSDGGSKVTSTGFTCPEPSPRMEVTSKELNIFVWTEYFPQDMLDCFELVYGVKLNRDEYSSNEEMYAKVSAGGTAYDLAQPTDYIVPLMIRQGLLQEMDHAKLPNLKNIASGWLNLGFDPGNKYSVPYLGGTDAIVVNTDAVENVPQSWADLWKPEYAGKIVSIDDSRAVIGATLLTLGYDVNTIDPAQLEEAKAKLAELVPNIKVFDSDSPKTALIAGDVDLGIVWTGEAFVANQENPAFQYIYPTEGPILWQDNFVMLKDAAHADAAYAWLSYMMQGDVFWLTIRDFQYTNPNAAALEYAKANQPEVYSAYADSPITNPPADVIANGHGIQDVGDATPLYDDIWVEVKGGN
ncbi:MAG: ABC transporter permease [Anaerolineae bacterium]|nr:MAG: ABC transporter permease [Anaerolineae bacterium]WKZ42500.1 MAG: spermidine/putrescine ABC transporter substrate-binding protein [Anaerolineales bacterium]